MSIQIQHLLKLNAFTDEEIKESDLIQIQHLLKLNSISIGSGGFSTLIQIQHLLKLNITTPGGLWDTALFKYNTC